MKLCKNCENRGRKKQCEIHTIMSNYAEQCKDFKENKQTNADRIRSMSDEELADYIFGVSVGNAPCVLCTEECDFCELTDEECKAKTLAWLQSEVKGSE